MVVNWRLTEVNAPARNARACTVVGSGSMRCSDWVHVVGSCCYCCCQTVASCIALARSRFCSRFVVFPLLTMSTDAPTGSRADVPAGGGDEGGGPREPTPFSPEQMVVIDRLIAARVAAASDPRATATTSLPSGSSSTTSTTGK